MVAPSTGAWIETIQIEIIRITRMVAPSTGAWIETSITPRAGRAPRTSLPLRERGLKRLSTPKSKGKNMSLPLRERGLKPPCSTIWIVNHQVAPSTGAWIETYSVGTGESEKMSLPLRERGLKPMFG